MRPVRTILVAVDFSPSSAEALERALDLAADLDAAIHLVHAYDVPLVELTPYHFAIPQSVWDGVREAAEAQLAELRDKLVGRGVEATPHLAEGPAPEAIVATAGDLGADLIVMGTRGHSRLAHALLGSVAERTLRRAHCPVLTVRSDG